MDKRPALLVVDVQNDFCPGGTLQITSGNRVVEPINRIAAYFRDAGLPILASRDWHPPVTSHFSDFGGIWPVHCVRGTAGAEFHEQLKLPKGTLVLSKGIDEELDGDSAFDGVTEEGRNLGQILKELEVQRIFVCGLATDYCVLNTAIEAVHNNFTVTVLTDAVAGVDLEAGESSRALIKMELAGAHLDSVNRFFKRKQ